MTATRQVTFTVNGTVHKVMVEPRTLLADALRGEVGITGTRLGCEHGVCGACTVLVGGEPVRSCLMLAVQADGRTVETVESLERPDGSLGALQQRFHEHHALQCGFCTPGILMSLTALFRTDPAPGESQIRNYVQGHICRCTGYQQIVEAALEHADHRGADDDR
jgi:aerobic-type carbon monoxide dehydrogenase small subunit (CoxS/CutS family)